MNEQEAREYAIEHGGARFSVCPVCDERLVADKPVGELEADLRAHCEGHPVVEYLAVINRLKTELTLVRAPFDRPPELVEVSYTRASLAWRCGECGQTFNATDAEISAHLSTHGLHPRPTPPRTKLDSRPILEPPTDGKPIVLPVRAEALARALSEQLPPGFELEIFSRGPAGES